MQREARKYLSDIQQAVTLLAEITHSWGSRIAFAQSWTRKIALTGKLREQRNAGCSGG